MDIARVGIRTGRQSFLLIVTNSARRQQLAWRVLSALHSEGVLHVDAEVIVTPYNELFLVIPAAVNDVESLVQTILRELGLRASIRLGRQEMPAEDFAAYDALAIMARTQGRSDPHNN